MQVSPVPQVSQMPKRPSPKVSEAAREKIQDFKEKISKAKQEAPPKNEASKAKSSTPLGLSGQDALALRQQS